MGTLGRALCLGKAGAGMRGKARATSGATVVRVRTKEHGVVAWTLVDCDCPLCSALMKRDRYREALAEISRSYGCGERCQWCDRSDHTDECPVGRAAKALEEGME